MHNVLTAVVLSCRQDHVPCRLIWLGVRVGHHALQRLQSLLEGPRMTVHFEGSIVGPDCGHDTAVYHLIHLRSDANFAQRQGSCQKQGRALHHLMHLHTTRLLPEVLSWEQQASRTQQADIQQAVMEPCANSCSVLHHWATAPKWEGPSSSTPCRQQ